MFTVSDFSSLIAQLLPEPQAGLLSGIAFGTKATLDMQLKDSLITTGTLHIVALSGMNVSILVNLLTQTLLPFIGRRKVCLLMVGLLIWFVSFVGPSPSIVRAALMGGISIIGVLLGRSVWPLGIWFLAAIFMVIWQPSWLFDLSFQLSVLATLGLMLFAGQRSIHTTNKECHYDRVPRSPDVRRDEVGGVPPKAARRGNLVFNELKSLILADLRVTLAAQVFTIPIVFFAFSRISLISPLTNILIGWTMPILTVLGWVVPITEIIWKPLAYLPSWVSYSLLSYVIWIVRITSIFPFASIQLK